MKVSGEASVERIIGKSKLTTRRRKRTGRGGVEMLRSGRGIMEEGEEARREKG